MNELKPEDVMKENDFLVRGISKEQLAEERVQALREGYKATLRKNDALIAKLEAYIDKLNEDKSYLVGQIADLQQMVLKKNAEIERLNAEIGRLGEQCRVFAIEYPKITRAEAITEFAERLKAEAVEVDVSMGYGNECWQKAVTEWEIDQIAKEMKGEENGGTDL